MSLGLVRTRSARSPTISVQVTQAFTVCSRGYQNTQCQSSSRRKAILLTSSCIRLAANSSAELMLCPYMAPPRPRPLLGHYIERAQPRPLLGPHSWCTDHWAAAKGQIHTQLERALTAQTGLPVCSSSYCLYSSCINVSHGLVFSLNE